MILITGSPILGLRLCFLLSFPRERNGFSERANVLVDEEGKVIFLKIYPISEFPDLEEVFSLLGESDLLPNLRFLGGTRPDPSKF